MTDRASENAARRLRRVATRKGRTLAREIVPGVLRAELEAGAVQGVSGAALEARRTALSALKAATAAGMQLEVAITRRKWVRDFATPNLCYALGFDQAETVERQILTAVARAFAFASAYSAAADRERRAVAQAAACAAALSRAHDALAWPDPCGSPMLFYKHDAYRWLCRESPLAQGIDVVDLLRVEPDEEKARRRAEIEDAARTLELFRREVVGVSQRLNTGRPRQSDFLVYAVRLGELFTILTGWRPVFHLKKRRDGGVAARDWRLFLRSAFGVAGLGEAGLAGIVRRMGGDDIRPDFEILRNRFSSSGWPIGLGTLQSTGFAIDVIQTLDANWCEKRLDD